MVDIREMVDMCIARCHTQIFPIIELCQNDIERTEQNTKTQLAEEQACIGMTCLKIKRLDIN